EQFLGLLHHSIPPRYFQAISSCSPSPCTRLSLARTTMGTPLPYGKFHLGNPRLAFCRTINRLRCLVRTQFSIGDGSAVSKLIATPSAMRQLQSPSKELSQTLSKYCQR